MALESFYIRVTHTGASSGVLLLSDVNSGFIRESASRVRRPGPVYVPVSGSVDLVLDSTVLLSYESGAIRQWVDTGELTVSAVGGVTQVLQYLYDFSVEGGAVGLITLPGINGAAKALPANLLLVRGWFDIVTTFTSGGSATVEVGMPANTDVFVTTNGTEVVAPINFKVATATNVVLEVKTAALTAGKAIVNLEVIASFS